MVTQVFYVQSGMSSSRKLRKVFYIAQSLYECFTKGISNKTGNYGSCICSINVIMLLLLLKCFSCV